MPALVSHGLLEGRMRPALVNHGLLEMGMRPALVNHGLLDGLMSSAWTLTALVALRVLCRRPRPASRHDARAPCQACIMMYDVRSASWQACIMVRHDAWAPCFKKLLAYSCKRVCVLCARAHACQHAHSCAFLLYL